METDSFFCQLLKQLPQTLFELLGLPSERALAYHFESVEIKKSLRIDGLFLPKQSELPAYFVELQFRRSESFYGNLFAKVFLFLEANRSIKDWAAVAIFESRRLEPKHLQPYQDLLRSGRVTRIYLDEYPIPADPPLGLGLLQLVSAPVNEVPDLMSRLVHKAEREIPDSEMGRTVIELVEELLLRRFTQLDREEVRKMFQLQDIRKSKVWQEAHETGIEKGERLAKKELARKLLTKGMSVKDIADLMEISLREARRLVKVAAK